jgi:hypothetical protein
VDDQVKIRGHRIEPSEVANVLRRHPGVSDAFVVAIDEETGRALSAHLVARDAPVSREELMAFFRTRLPSYMMPAKVFWHDSLPLTPHGKVNRTALARLALEQAPEAVPAKEAPKTHMEQLVSEVWSSVLGVPVGRYDDFFDCGGHSLLASQIVTRLGSRTGAVIPLKLIFEYRTPAALAGVIESRRDAVAAAPPPQRSNTTREGTGPLALQQEHVWLLGQLFPNHTFFHVNVTCRIEGPLDIKRLEQALHALAMRHEALRTTFTFDDTTGPVQRISPGPIIEFQVTEAAGADETRRTLSDVVRQPFDLETAPLWRALVVREAPDVHVLAASIHHIICDGASLDLLIRELAALYRGEILPGAPMQYLDFVRWQREHLLPERLPQQMSYWREQLEGELTPLPLGGRTGRSDLDFQMRTSQAHLGIELSERFRATTARSGATLFSSLLAVLALGLRRLTGHTDLRIATLLANRGRMELENVVGLLTNMVILRLRMTAEDSAETTLQRATRTVVDAFENGELPFEEILAELQATRTIERGLLAQIMLLVEETKPPALEIPGLTVTPYDDEEETTARASLSGHDCVLLGAWRADGLTLTLRYKESAMGSGSALRLLEFITEEIKALSAAGTLEAAVSIHG